ncbi:hypothetical protein CPB84DRAFT_1846125 [Gymnopilus junonius]|uniref:Uncharacterized protein n=1 Tax=Gymnopilus junonius TaxID=109634 RepID=A0A9P5NQB3_GYMJU|nr:hypothetical protein CPB84DRAFT_1846125 [Gymnopilus junonius]
MLTPPAESCRPRRSREIWPQASGELLIDQGGASPRNSEVSESMSPTVLNFEGDSLDTPPASPTESERSFDCPPWKADDPERRVYTTPVVLKDVPLPHGTPTHVRAYMLADVGSNDWYSKDTTVIRLWNTSPNLRLDKKLQKNHVQLGDVGYFTREGGFRTLFNIFMTKKKNRQMHYSPPTYFQPFKRELRDQYTDINRLDKEYHTSEEFKRCREEEKGDCVYSFRSEPVRRLPTPGCAILITPEGLQKHFFNIDYQKDIRLYINHQTESWYRDLVGDNGPLPNGSLMLVEVCYRANTWASAALVGKKYKPGLHANLKQGERTTKIYHWDSADLIHVDRGSSKPDMVDGIDSGEGRSVAIEVSSIWYGRQPRELGRSRGPRPHSTVTRFSLSKLSSARCLSYHWPAFRVVVS